ncbi:MAG: class I SAM-dependent methyltransferase [Phycisphaerales bacterium]|nr:class I SAM-dependent methyltransferase [Phycisphaerales bacterium]MCI0675734.1 class I SAM-dependent methyltransferase [Phycisphaerales bacterium]
MPHRARQKYLQPYREAVERFGPSFHATLWSSPEAQRIRFDVMIELADVGQRRILDAGCGTGDFAARLIDRNIPFSHYIGVDAVDEMIQAARARNLPRCEFKVADLIHDFSIFHQLKPDVVCISGTLNTMDEGTARQLVQAAFDASAHATIFNFLSDRASRQWLDRNIGPARRFNTIDWIDWALRRTSRVSFTQQYLEGHDATILMRKESGA